MLLCLWQYFCVLFFDNNASPALSLFLLCRHCCHGVVFGELLQHSIAAVCVCVGIAIIAILWYQHHITFLFVHKKTMETQQYAGNKQTPHKTRQTTGVLTAAMIVYAIGAGITAAAGTRLALQLILITVFGSHPFQVPSTREGLAGLLRLVAASPKVCVGIGQFACLLPTLVVVAVSQAPSPESNPDSPLPVTATVVHYTTVTADRSEVHVTKRQNKRYDTIMGLLLSSIIPSLSLCVCVVPLQKKKQQQQTTTSDLFCFLHCKCICVYALCCCPRQ